jgi:hypothetical protein
VAPHFVQKTGCCRADRHRDFTPIYRALAATLVVIAAAALNG